MSPELLSKIPLAVFCIASLVYLIGGFIIVYHLIRFGVGNIPKNTALVFFCGSIILLLITAIFFIKIF